MKKKRKTGKKTKQQQQKQIKVLENGLNFTSIKKDLNQPKLKKDFEKFSSATKYKCMVIQKGII